MKTLYLTLFTAVSFFYLGKLQSMTSDWQKSVVLTSYKEGQQDIMIAAIEND